MSLKAELRLSCCWMGGCGGCMQHRKLLCCHVKSLKWKREFFFFFFFFFLLLLLFCFVCAVVVGGWDLFFTCSLSPRTTFIDFFWSNIIFVYSWQANKLCHIHIATKSRPIDFVQLCKKETFQTHLCTMSCILNYIPITTPHLLDVGTLWMLCFVINAA